MCNRKRLWQNKKLQPELSNCIYQECVSVESIRNFKTVAIDSTLHCSYKQGCVCWKCDDQEIQSFHLTTFLQVSFFTRSGYMVNSRASHNVQSGEPALKEWDEMTQQLVVEIVSQLFKGWQLFISIWPLQATGNMFISSIVCSVVCTWGICVYSRHNPAV